MPVFLLTMFGKTEQDLTRAERNHLAAFTRILVEAYAARGRD